MSDFKELVKNLYTSKDRELTPEKFDYIQKTYSNGKEQEFVKNFYATIGEDLTEEKLTYISDTYLKKKDTPTASSATPSQLPKISQPINPLQQGANIVGGGVIGEISKTVPKSSIKEAALADKKKNESYLGALWNNAVGSVARLAGGAARATYQFSGNPVIQMERELLDKAGKAMGKNLLAAKEKEYADVVKGVIEKGRTSASSKEYERQIAEGFDVTNGVGFSDLKGVVAMLPQFIADMGLAVGTGGGSFAIQGYDDALSMVDEMPEGSNISEGTRVAFGVGGALVVGALEKLGLDNLIKNPAAKKYVTAKILKEATDELVKKGVKVTADQFEKTVIDKASKLTAKELGKLVAKRGVKSATIEGGTEAIQEGGMDLLKLAANKIEGKEIFDEEEMKDTAAKRYLNSFVAGGILGGIGGSVASRVQNTETAIKDRLAKSKTIEDIDGIVSEINDNVVDGTMTQEEADNVLPIVENFVEVSQKVPADLNGKNKVEAVDLINEREKLAEQIKQVEEQKAVLDPSFHPLYEGDIERIQERVDEINKELAELAKPENNVEEVVVEEINQPIEEVKTKPIKEETIVSDLVDKKVELNGKVGVIKQDEGGKITFENNETIIELQGDETAKEITTPKIQVKDNNVTIDNDSYEFVSTNKDENGNVVSVTLKDANGRTITKRDADLALDIAIAKNNAEFDSKRDFTPQEYETEVKGGINVEFQKEFGGAALQVIESMPDEVADTFAAMEAGIVAISPNELQQMVITSTEWVDKAKQEILNSKAPQKEKNDAIKMLDKFNKDLNKYYEKVEKQRKGQDASSSKAKPTKSVGKDKQKAPTLEFQEGKKEPKEEKVFDKKDLDRAKAKKIHQRVREMEAPTSDAAQIALRYIADGGKVSEAAINEVAGTVKRARLNTGAKELKSNEAKSRDYYQKDGETLDELAHRLWENSGQEVSEIDIKDALMSVIGDYNTRLEAGTAYLEQYNAQYQEEKYYERLAEQYKEEFEEEQRKIEEMFREPLEEEILGLASEEHINNLIKQYENELNRENQEPKPTSKDDANKKVGGRASGEEGGKPKAEVGKQPIGEAEAENVVVKLSDLPSRAFAVAITVDRFDELKKKILDEGFTQPIIIDKETGNVLDGQRRLFVAESMGLKEVPAIYMNNPTREELNKKVKELESKNKKAEAEPKQEDVEDADVFYHSTNKDFEGFDDKKIGTNKDFGWFGLGHYFTSNKEESKYYGKNVIEINISKIKDKIYKAVLSNQSIKIPKSVFDYIEKNLKNFKDYELGTYDNFKVGNLIDKEGSKIFSDAFKNEGYLGVRVSGDANELVIFESKNIPKKENVEPKQKEEKKEEPKKDNLAEKARNKAAKLRSGEENVLPDWLKADLPKGTKKQGASINEAYAAALETFADVYEKAQDFKKAVDEAFKKLSDWYNENNIDFDEKDLKEKFEAEMQGKKQTADDSADRFEVKSILNRIANSTNISEEVRAKFKSNLKYKVSSQAQAREVAKELIAEFGYKDALAMAEMGRFEGDVNSFIFAESLDNAFDKESKATTPEEKAKFAEEWKDIAIRYDEAARDKGRFISAIQDFYKKSPLGIVMVEESKRGEQFRDWFSSREKPFKEVFEELVKEPEFEQLLDEKVKDTLKKERGENRAKRRTKIENFFDSAKFKGDALYAVPIPPKVINAALDLMKNSFLAGESVVNAVEVAIDYITKEVGQWDKEKFRKEYQEKLQGLDGGKTTKTEQELTEEKKEKILDKFRKKLKGLSESQKEEVIRKSFKRLVENGALEYEDFKDIIADVLGYGKMTDAEVAKITELVNDINEVDKLAAEIRKDENRSIENLKKYKEAKKKAEKSATQLATLVYNKPDILKRLLSIMQLNTLGIPSLINNPLFNIFNQATVRFPVGLQVSALDQIIYGASKVGNKLFGTDVILPENNVIASQREFIRKLFQGASESGSQLVNGLTNRDYFQKEVYASQIQPFTSAQDLWDWKFKGKKLTPSQLADKSIQATIGLPAEVVARLLNIGDKPQRFAAEGAKAAVLAKQLGLSEVDYEYFLEFPKEEAYRSYKEQGMTDEAAMEKAEKTKEAIVKAGEESVFQQDNFLNDAINSIFEQSKKYGNVPHGIAQAVKMLNFPYLKIPLNAFWSVYNLVNPEVAFTQSAYYSLKAIKTKDRADIQKAKMWAAHGTTGMALLAIAGGLVAKGIVNADNDDETTKKERMGEKQYEQQKSINISKLNALLQGQDPDKVKNGLNVDLKYFGNMGNIMNTVAIRQENMTAEQKAQGANYMNELFSNLSQSSLELIDNGVFSNVSSLVTAFDRGGNYMDNYLLNLINMTTNIVQPAMFAQMSRAQLPYYSKVKADSFYEELKNNVLARSSVVRELTDKYPPAQIGIWGDKLERKDDFLLKWFGMSRVNKDNFAQPIYEDYKRTKNTEFLPPSIKPLINKNKLNVKQAEELEVLVGQSRKALIAPYVNNLATLDGFGKKYSKLKDGEKIKALDILYQQGFEKAKNDFIKKYPQFESKLEKSKDKEDFDEKTKEFRESIKED